MGWKESFNGGVGKFRDAEFIANANDLTFGRRKQKHEYPLRDFPFIEDMGGSAREFSIKAYVIGPEYMTARDKLIAALEEKGPGTLEHPYFGTLNVEVFGQSSLSESTDKGGSAEFSVTFIVIDSENKELVETDTEAELVEAVDESQLEAVNDFAAVYDTLEQAQDFVDEVQSEIENALQTVEDAVNGIIDPITALIRAPFNLGSAIMGTFNNIKNKIKDPFRALSLYDGLFYSGSSTKPTAVKASKQIPQTTSNRLQQIDNTAAVHRLIQQAAITEACLLASTLTFSSVNDAIALRDRLLDAIDAQVEELAVQSSAIVVSDKVYDTLQQLRATLVEFIRIEAAKLPRVTYFENKASLPALVLAHRIHVNAHRESEIVARNHIRHPGFIAGGKSLEVLTDA